ncbi:porin family protein [Bradyrhizobium lablabi]|uniref:outer membrane protein n=1 Tax=Bradyrhizobium lablabi TaxID=722472 RepID=UPI001BAE2E55|nr:outer membrane beta-barrel protein [Bradyrhizobium lablabi]MBR1120845.1 porin family protein [Bradyrhizobium lablabi]
MKRSGLVILALAASVSAACAADMPAAARAPVKAPISPAFNWSGFYVGVMGGYGWSDRASVNGFATTGNDFSGGFAGGTVGFNYQPVGSAFVIGIEADAAWADIGRSTTVGIVTVADKMQAFGSVTGRVGFAADTVLLYAKGGYAWLNNEISGTALGVTISESQTHNGWTVGGGVEFAFAGNWSAKGEYMFARYSEQTYLAALAPPGLSVGFDVHTVKAGINYRFGWGGPVVAKY